MKKIIIFSAIVAFLAGCKNETVRELKGYRFQKEYAQTDSVANKHLTGSVTIDMYVMLHAYPTSWTNVIAKMMSDRECEFCFRLKNEKQGQFFFGSGDYTPNVSVDISSFFELNKWQRITLVREIGKGELRVYANGNLLSKKQFSRKKIKGAKLTNSPIYVAGVNKRGGNMTIADVKIWRKAMSDEEIKRGWSNLTNIKDDNSLVAFWNFDEIIDNQIDSHVHSDLSLTIRNNK